MSEGSPPPTSTTAPGVPPATTRVTRLDVGLSVSKAADVVISFAVEPGMSGVPGVRCHSTLPDAGSSTRPVNVPGTASAGLPSAAPSPDSVGSGAEAASGPSARRGSGGCTSAVGVGCRAAISDGLLSATALPTAAAVTATTNTVTQRRSPRPGTRSVCPIRRPNPTRGLLCADAV